MNTIQKVIAPFLITVLLLLSSCTDDSSSSYDQVQQETTQNKESSQEVSEDATKGGAFNQFFPKGGNGYDTTFTQEKAGFAQVSLKQDGKEVALLSISDTISDSSVAEKFEGSSESIQGYPMVKQGTKKTSVLVGNRYQVTVRSKDDSFTESDREEWLGKFNLQGLESLQ